MNQNFLILFQPSDITILGEHIHMLFFLLHCSTFPVFRMCFVIFMVLIVKFIYLFIQKSYVCIFYNIFYILCYA